MPSLYDRLVRWQYRRIARGLSRLSPDRLARESAAAAVDAFHRAVRSVPGYRALLADCGADPSKIRNVDDFVARVPVTDKESLFQKRNLRTLCRDGDTRDVRFFFSSSGSTGVFSFGTETRTEERHAALEVEFILEDAFQALSKRTLLINALSAGINIPTRTLPTIVTGARLDIAWTLIKALRSDYDQFVLVGEQLLLKKLIEDGFDAGVPWKDLVLHIVSGAEYVAENFRGYLGGLLGHDSRDRDRGSINISFGLSEIANSIAKETPETQELRRLAMADAGVRQLLYGPEAPVCGALLQYNPRQYFIETTRPDEPRSEMILTTLDPKRKIPLIRYNTRDVIALLTYERLKTVTKEIGRPDLLPKHGLPFLIVWGKHKGLDAGNGSRVFPEGIKEALYADPAVAAAVTGFFRLEKTGEKVRLHLQLRGGRSPGGDLSSQLQSRLKEFVRPSVDVVFHNHREYPYAAEQSFDRKPVYL